MEACVHQHLGQQATGRASDFGGGWNFLHEAAANLSRGTGGNPAAPTTKTATETATKPTTTAIAEDDDLWEQQQQQQQQAWEATMRAAGHTEEEIAAVCCSVLFFWWVECVVRCTTRRCARVSSTFEPCR
jgi:hypothetical protein